MTEPGKRRVPFPALGVISETAAMPIRCPRSDGTKSLDASETVLGEPDNDCARDCAQPQVETTSISSVFSRDEFTKTVA